MLDSVKRHVKSGNCWEFAMAVLSRPGVKLEPHQVVLRPLVTEKGTHLSTRHNAYCFQVAMIATKEDVKSAVELLWKVKVVESGFKPARQATPHKDRLCADQTVEEGHREVAR